MLVRSVRHQGIFRWKKQDVFLTEVLWGENVGLLPQDDRWFTIYFAQYPLARFDSHKLAVMPLPKTHAAGEGGTPPSLAAHSILREDPHVSTIPPDRTGAKAAALLVAGRESPVIRRRCYHPRSVPLPN